MPSKLMKRNRSSVACSLTEYFALASKSTPRLSNLAKALKFETNINEEDCCTDKKLFRNRKQMIEHKFLNGLLYTCKFLCNMARVVILESRKQNLRHFKAGQGKVKIT